MDGRERQLLVEIGLGQIARLGPGPTELKHTQSKPRRSILSPSRRRPFGTVMDIDNTFSALAIPTRLPAKNPTVVKHDGRGVLNASFVGFRQEQRQADWQAQPISAACCHCAPRVAYTPAVRQARLSSQWPVQM
jgi:hypothetical protein